MRKKITLNKKEKTFEEGYKEFLNYCKVKNLSPQTIKSYNNTIVYRWYKFFDKDNLISSITKTTVNNFILEAKESGIKPVSVNSLIRSLRAVLYYFMELEYMPTFKIKMLKIDKEIIETYTDAEIKLLLAKPNMKKCNFAEYRNWVVCNFLLGTGCRTSTLLNIKVSDVDLDNGIVTYTHTKGRRQQIVPLSKTLQLVLTEYISRIDNKGYLFPNSFGEHMTPSTLGHNLNDYTRRRGVNTTGLHRWRHTFAKNWILNGGDVFRLQKMLGHTDMTIVRNYVNMFDDDLKMNFDDFNPLEKVCINKKSIRLR
ncbi:tyrosine-type recombinase/integrase [Clostridium paraputrificum]|uniref:tyrosine-type recombinase/integrase n=1 Tax=Clostridium paraputrificum TaxID=29363 RepID=UPI000424B080|nr:tyrosine-type recombinase/integrase [Clostridium paraputrificum]